MQNTSQPPLEPESVPRHPTPFLPVVLGPKAVPKGVSSSPVVSPRSVHLWGQHLHCLAAASFLSWGQVRHQITAASRVRGSICRGGGAGRGSKTAHGSGAGEYSWPARLCAALRAREGAQSGTLVLHGDAASGLLLVHRWTPRASLHPPRQARARQGPQAGAGICWVPWMLHYQPPKQCVRGMQKRAETPTLHLNLWLQSPVHCGNLELPACQPV